LSNIELPVRREHAIDGKKRFRYIAMFTTSAALCASLIAGVAGPASAAVREPAQSASISLASSDSGLTTAARYVRLSNGRLTFDSADAAKAGANSHALSIESAIVANLNKDLVHGTTAANTVKAAAASTQSTTITLLPGFTITFSSTGVVVYISKADVTEFENVATFAKDLASLIASGGVAATIAAAILSVLGPVGVSATVIAGLVTAAFTFLGGVIGLASDVLKICTAADGSATFTLPFASGFPWIGIPTCSAQ
jgi:hypothetical protein